MYAVGFLTLDSDGRIVHHNIKDMDSKDFLRSLEFIPCRLCGEDINVKTGEGTHYRLDKFTWLFVHGKCGYELNYHGVRSIEHWKSFKKTIDKAWKNWRGMQRVES